MVIKSAETDEKTALVGSQDIVFSIDELKDVVIEGRNDHATLGIDWSVHAWRVPKISKLDSGRERHNPVIPASADEILAQVLIAATAQGVTQTLDNDECYTHAGIKYIRATSDALGFVGSYFGRYDIH